MKIGTKLLMALSTIRPELIGYLLSTISEVNFSGALFGIIATVVAILLGTYVFANISANLPEVTTATHGEAISTAYNNTITNAATGFQLVSILPIVMFAGLILAGVSVYLAWGKRGE